VSSADRAEDLRRLGEDTERLTPVYVEHRDQSVAALAAHRGWLVHGVSQGSGWVVLWPRADYAGLSTVSDCTVSVKELRRLRCVSMTSPAWTWLMRA
jgi:hypothetical protein